MSALTEIQGPTRSARLARILVWGIFGIAVIVGTLSLGFGVGTVVGDIVSGHTELTMITEHGLPAASNGGTATVVSGGYSTADIVGTHFSGGLVALALTSLIADVLTRALLAAVIAVLAWRSVRGGAFRASVSLTFVVGGGILAVGAMLSEATNTMATGLAATELNATGHSGFWDIAGRFDPTLVVVGVAIMLVGIVFTYAEKLQHETDGLV